MAEEQHDACRGREEDELLAERVDAAVVVDGGVDDVVGVPLGHGDAVQDEAVWPAVVAEVGESGERPEEEDGEQGRCGQEEG